MWVKNDIENALNCTINDSHFNKISINSREINKGDIFIGIKGMNFDGNQFASDALKNGASLVIINRLSQEIHSQQVLLVEDTYKDGLLKLAKYKRENHNGTYIGITGSVGKTTTKEMLKCVLQNDVYASHGNLNNHYGLPLSLCNIDNSRFGVFELGMSTPGEISFLSSILRPHIAIITSIGPAHLENFISLDNIAAAKAEIIDGLTPDGFLIVNFDSISLDIILKVAADKNVIGYTMNNHSNAQVSLLKSKIIAIDNLLFTMIDVRYKTLDGYYNQISYKINGIGDDLISNSLAVLTTLILLGLDVNMIMHLDQFKGVSGRGTICHIGTKDILLIDESYNSNPISLGIALKRMSLYSNFTKYKRKIAILGDMLELGTNELELHRKVIDNINKYQIDSVISIGKRMRALYDILDSKVKTAHFETSYDAANVINSYIENCDLVMVKGSNSIKMHNICQAIQNH